MNYCVLVTGPAYGTQQASSAYQFASALLDKGHRMSSVFFYREGVLNANQLTAPAGDEFDLVRAWRQLAQQHSVRLNVCIAAALRRGVTNKKEARQQGLRTFNLQPGFTLIGLSALAEAFLSCDRIVQF
ncbi:Sulfurtransferase TusD [Serratia symbiotica]|nr:Sulfurtransferase TusD [Serratia symbiotica]